MKIFKENRMTLIRAGLGTDQLACIAGRNIPRSLIRFYIILFSTLLTVWEAVLGIKFLGSSLVDCLSSFVCLLGFLPVITIYLSLIMKTSEINELFSYLENVINTRKATESFAIYERSNANTNRIIRKVISIGYKAVSLAFFVPGLFLLLYVVFGFPSPDLWFTPLAIEKLSTIFKTPIGFIVVVAIGVLAALAYMLTFAAFTTIYVVISRNIESIADDISMTVALLNANIDQNTTSKYELKQIVQLHLHSYKLLEMLGNIIRGPIFYQISGLPILNGMSLYLFEVQLNELSANIASYVAALLYVSFSNYMLCYFVTNAILHAMSIGDRIYDLHWYELSPNEQIFVQLIIQHAQRPIELKGLGVFVCSLETFLKMARGAVSYYTIFRKL